MDGKAKKIVNFMKKSGSELDAFDIAVGVKMDEDLVLKILKELKQEKAVAEKTNEKGQITFCVAAAPAGENPAKSKEEMPEPKPPKDKSTRIITENEVLDIGDFSPKPAAKRAEVDLDDFSPKKAKKERVKKEPVDLDDDLPAKSLPPVVKHAIPAVCALAVLITVFFIGGSTGSGKINKAVSNATSDFVKAVDFQPVKDNVGKISSMEEEIKVLKASLEKMEAKIKELESRSAAPRAAASRPAPRRR
ncbi:MAG: hypothetical protein LBI42_00405 [Chitinispirillales bacterium]|jgi:hypothetical protein|nr:hypothetical protein [Chitinispirillales bacterium]